MSHKGQPTVILAKTVKGFGLGKGGEGQMVAHQQKKLSEEDLRIFRDRFNIPVSDADIAGLPFRKPGREQRGNPLPARAGAARSAATCRAAAARAPALAVPPLEAFASLLEGTGEREISTTMAFVRLLTVLLKDKSIGKNIVPIVPDEARTFGMEGLFRQIGIYSSVGQLYTPQDAETLMSYREDKKGQMLEEGINEARLAVLVDCRGHRLQQPRHQHGAVLHLLLDVRLPARRRFHLGGRRHPGARLPARRDCRAHDARRRGPAAPGRPQPAGRAARCRTASPTIRPTPTSWP